MVKLYDYQKEAIDILKNGSILCGAVGTGKSITALSYYFTKVCGGEIYPQYKKMKRPKDIYIITTAKKRDSKEWELEYAPFLLDIYDIKVVVDSWNNIKKYQKAYDAFFIFDEQRVVGSGAWVKAFLDITRKNQWILLSATPGDTWKDYIPVFIANGFYKNKTEFNRRHVVFSRFAKYPKIERYVDTKTLVKHRNDILVHMKGETSAYHHEVEIPCEYDKANYMTVVRKRWDIYENEPIKETGKLCYLMRRVVNSDPSRLNALIDILEKHPKAIVFYNFDYELELIKSLLNDISVEYAEWNGKKHQEVPTNKKGWCYLVQYNAGAEGWNCITTDTMIFYSQNYSYRISIQAKGRIDRLNTPFTELYYYSLISKAPIDIGIKRSLACKQNFNERSFLKI